MSSFQICSARSAGLPLAESPPVSAMPRPILIGSAARATNAPEPTRTSTKATTPITAQVRIDCLKGSIFIPVLSLCAPPVGGRQSVGRPRLPSGKDLVKAAASMKRRAGSARSRQSSEEVAVGPLPDLAAGRPQPAVDLGPPRVPVLRPAVEHGDPRVAIAGAHGDRAGAGHRSRVPEIHAPVLPLTDIDAEPVFCALRAQVVSGRRLGRQPGGRVHLPER